MDRPLVLASSSPYRRQLLERLALPFTSASPDIDEAPQPDEPPDLLAERLAVAKAEALARTYPHHLIIGSDQTAAVHGELLGKPGSFDKAAQQLRRQSGHRVIFHTGVAVLDSATGRVRHDLDITRVHFRQLNDRDIAAYLEHEAPFDCAGSFKCEGLGIALFDKIESDDPTALTGLPLIALCRLLRQEGVKLL